MICYLSVPGCLTLPCDLPQKCQIALSPGARAHTHTFIYIYIYIFNCSRAALQTAKLHIPRGHAGQRPYKYPSGHNRMKGNRDLVWRVGSKGFFPFCPHSLSISRFLNLFVTSLARAAAIEFTPHHADQRESRH